MRVYVLLSTYEGERWLEAQLDSLLAQSHPDLRVQVRVDGSEDGTQALLACFAARDPRITWSAGPNLGAAQSFLELLAGVGPDAGAVAFCDQDDVWETDHLERAVDALAGYTEAPAMWCSDMTVCDEQLRPLRRHDVVRRGPSFANALVENVAPGCTIVLNRAAVDVVRAARPVHAVMHDAWCYLVVAALGAVIYDPKPSVRYRLHAANTMGLSQGKVAVVAARVRRASVGPHVRAWTRQAANLRAAYADQLPVAVAGELDRFLAGRCDLRARLRYALMGRAHRQSRAGTLAMRASYLLGRL